MKNNILEIFTEEITFNDITIKLYFKSMGDISNLSFKAYSEDGSCNYLIEKDNTTPTKYCFKIIKSPYTNNLFFKEVEPQFNIIIFKHLNKFTKQ